MKRPTVNDVAALANVSVSTVSRVINGSDKVAPDLAERLVSSDQRLSVFRLLHDLPEPYREVFTLRTFGELSHAEIGSLFGKSESWSRVTYYRGRQLLRRMAEEEEAKHET